MRPSTEGPHLLLMFPRARYTFVGPLFDSRLGRLMVLDSFFGTLVCLDLLIYCTYVAGTRDIATEI